MRSCGGSYLGGRIRNARAVLPAGRVFLHFRTNNVISDLILVDQVEPGFTSAGFARKVRAALADPDHQHLGTDEEAMPIARNTN
jgi:hypothetical protein